MRTKNFLTMAALAGAMTLAGCTNTDEVTIENSNFPADGVIRVTTNVDAPMTRAGMTTDNIDDFDIKIDNANNSNYSYYGNFYKLNNSWNSSQQMLWQNNTQQVTVTALSQFGSGSDKDQFESPSTQYDVIANQSNETGLKQSDILYMKSTIIDPSKHLVEGKLLITFKHLLSKVNISVTLGTELNTTPGTATNPISALKVNGTKRSFRWSASTNSEFAFTGFSNAAITPFVGTYTAGSGTATNAVANYEVILVPQTVAANGFSVTFTIGDKVYTWTSAAAVTLERGKQYALALTAGKDIVTLGSLSAKAWTTGTGGSIETE